MEQKTTYNHTHQCATQKPRLDRLLRELPSQLPALPYWMLDIKRFKGQLGVPLRRYADEILTSLLPHYWGDPERFTTDDMIAYCERHHAVIGDVTGQSVPVMFEDRPHGIPHTTSINAGREVATSLIIAWPVTYPFLWTTYRELVNLLPATVDLLILLPNPAWATLVENYLDGHAVNTRRKYCTVEGLIDIWVQDFVPLLVRQDGELVAIEADYAAPGMDQSYIDKLQQAGRTVATRLGARLYPLDLKLDWGNFVYCNGRAVLTDRVLRDNKGKTAQQIITLLKKELGVSAVIIPHDSEDPTGHIDGTVRFINEKTLFLARFDDDKGLFEDQKKALERGFNDFTIVPVPCGAGRPTLLNPDECDATGCYLNYIELPDRIIMPSYDSKLDEQARKLLAQHCNKEVVCLNCSSLAPGGGAVRCVSKVVSSAHT